jgi:CheY-like chemotaxis protein
MTRKMTFNWKNKTILVAEDEPANYMFLERIISSTNATLIRANNGAEAIQLALKIEISIWF